MSASKVRRNSACPCGSGRKYKQCCEVTRGRMSLSMRVALVAAAGLLIAGLVLVVSSSFNADSNAPGRVWSPEHGHYH